MVAPRPGSPLGERGGHGRGVALIVLLLALVAAPGCATRIVRTMEVTGYCGCGDCTGWDRGSWKYLKLDFWNRYVNYGPHKGSAYGGRTASGTKPRQPQPGLMSVDTLVHPWMLPIRLVFPWLWFARDGTLAADTRHHPFGTRMYIPGYGHGRVEDRGGAIKGPDRIDAFFDSHRAARNWGRQRLPVTIER